MLAILIVEDDPIIALDLEGTILDLGHRVSAWAGTAADAVEAAAQHGPDLILMDFNLAGDVDGAEAATCIRRYSEAPILFVAGHANTDCRSRTESIPKARIVRSPRNNALSLGGEQRLRGAGSALWAASRSPWGEPVRDSLPRSSHSSIAVALEYWRKSSGKASCASTSLAHSRSSNDRVPPSASIRW